MEQAAQAVALFDERPFFERALQHGVRHGILVPEKLAAMCQEAPKGMVQIARYFGTEYLRPDLELARTRLVNLVSLYLEDSCGGDLDRVIDAPAGEQPFLRHLKRLSTMLDGVRPPIVCLTTVTPLMSRVVLLRERYEAELSPLRRADWLLFLDRDSAFFASEALRRGRLEHDRTTALWHGPAGMRFLVVTRESSRAELESGMVALAHLALDASSDVLPSRPRLAITRKLRLPWLDGEDE